MGKKRKHRNNGLHKEHIEAMLSKKDYTFSDVFPINEEEYQTSKSIMPPEIERLSDIFIKYGNVQAELYLGLRKDNLFDYSLKGLFKIKDVLHESFVKASKLNKEYSLICRDSHPDFCKFANYFLLTRKIVDEELRRRADL